MIVIANIIALMNRGIDMATKRPNPLMTAAKKREDDQADVKAKVVGTRKKPEKATAKKAEAPEQPVQQDDELLTKKTARKKPATTLTLYIKVEDKIKLKAYCDKNGISCAEAVHDWIQTLA